MKNEYFRILFSSFLMRSDTLSDLKGTAMKNIVSLDLLRQIFFPLPLSPNSTVSSPKSTNSWRSAMNSKPDNRRSARAGAGSGSREPCGVAECEKPKVVHAPGHTRRYHIKHHKRHNSNRRIIHGRWRLRRLRARQRHRCRLWRRRINHRLKRGRCLRCRRRCRRRPWRRRCGWRYILRCRLWRTAS